MLRTFIVTFADGRTVEREGLSALQVRRSVEAHTSQLFTVRVATDEERCAVIGRDFERKLEVVEPAAV